MKTTKRTSFLTLFIGFFLTLNITSCSNDIRFSPERIKGELIPVNSNTDSDAEITEYIEPYKNAIQKEMDNVLAFSTKSLSKKDSQYNTAIGNMMADAVYEMTNPIFEKRAGYPFNAVLLNYGGIRSSLNQGPVTTRTAYELMPFENEVVVVELSGKQINEMFEYLKEGTAHPIAGITLELNEKGEILKAQIQGKDINVNDTYFIATSDYLKNGGDNMNFFNNPISTLPIDYKIRNVLIDYFKKHDTIAPIVDNRFTKNSK